MGNSDRFPLDRRSGSPDRRSGSASRGPMDNRRARFSLGYFFLAFLLLVALQPVLARQGTDQIAYSELKERIASGQVASVRIGPTVIEAVPVDTIVRETGIRIWRSTPVPFE